MDVIRAHLTRFGESYVDYVKTAFGTQYPGLEAMSGRDVLLRQPGAICQEPWIEPIPRYKHVRERLFVT